MTTLYTQFCGLSIKTVEYSQFFFNLGSLDRNNAFFENTFNSLITDELWSLIFKQSKLLDYCYTFKLFCIIFKLFFMTHIIYDMLTVDQFRQKKMGWKPECFPSLINASKTENFNKTPLKNSQSRVMFMF